MIYWRSQTEGLAAPWLDGNPNVVRRGRYVWVGSPVVSPDLDACQWLNMGNGWDVATLTDPQKLRPQDYIKPLSWSSMAPPVEDALAVSGYYRHCLALMVPHALPNQCGVKTGNG